jgi:hypothetical protein
MAGRRSSQRVFARWLEAFIPKRLAHRAVARQPGRFGLNGEQKKKRDEQREDAQRFGHGEAEDETAELAISG